MTHLKKLPSVAVTVNRGGLTPLEEQEKLGDGAPKGLVEKVGEPSGFAMVNFVSESHEEVDQKKNGKRVVPCGMKEKVVDTRRHKEGDRLLADAQTAHAAHVAKNAKESQRVTKSSNVRNKKTGDKDLIDNRLGRTETAPSSRGGPGTRKDTQGGRPSNKRDDRDASADRRHLLKKKRVEYMPASGMANRSGSSSRPNSTAQVGETSKNAFSFSYDRIEPICNFPNECARLVSSIPEEDCPFYNVDELTVKAPFKRMSEGIVVAMMEARRMATMSEYSLRKSKADAAKLLDCARKQSARLKEIEPGYGEMAKKLMEYNSQVEMLQVDLAMERSKNDALMKKVEELEQNKREASMMLAQEHEEKEKLKASVEWEIYPAKCEVADKAVNQL